MGGYGGKGRGRADLHPLPLNGFTFGSTLTRTITDVIILTCVWPGILRCSDFFSVLFL